MLVLNASLFDNLNEAQKNLDEVLPGHRIMGIIDSDGTKQYKIFGPSINVTIGKNDALTDL